MIQELTGNETVEDFTNDLRERLLTDTPTVAMRLRGGQQYTE